MNRKAIHEGGKSKNLRPLTGCGAEPHNLQQRDVGVFKDLAGVLVPDGGLHFADVGLAQQQHAQAGLADAAAHRQGELAFQQHLVERKLAALVAARQRQLTIQRFRADANAHRGDFQRTIQNRVIEQDIAVHLPIVVVRCAAVVRLAGAQLAADALDEHGAVLFGERIFALLGRQIGVQIFQLLCGDEGDMAVQQRRIAQLGILAAHGQLRVADAGDDARHSLMQREEGARFRCDDLAGNGTKG